MAMQKTLVGISSLLACIGIMLCGHGLLGTLLSLRGVAEGFQEGTIGVIMSMYFLGFISGTFLCPKLIRQVGHIRTLAALAAITAGVSILQGIWINVPAWSLMRYISGICIVGMFMVIESWLNSLASNTIRGRIFAIYVLVNLSFLGAGQFLIMAADIHTLDLFAIAGALFSFSLVPVALTRLPEPEPVRQIRIGPGDLYRTSPLGFAGCFISGLTGSAFWSLAPLFALHTGLTEFGIAVFMSTTILGGIVLSLPLGLWSDRIDRRLTIMLAGFCSATVTLLALLTPIAPSWWLSTCMFMFGGMMFSIYPLSVAHANDHPNVDRVALSTNLLLVYGIGATFGPLIAGMLMYSLGHYSLMGYFCLMGLMLGGFAWYRRKYGVEIPVAAQTSFVPLTRTSQVMAEALYPDRQE